MRRAFTAEEISELTAMAVQGHSSVEIAIWLQRWPQSTRAKAAQLGISLRPKKAEQRGSIRFRVRQSTWDALEDEARRRKFRNVACLMRAITELLVADKLIGAVVDIHPKSAATQRRVAVIARPPAREGVAL